MKMSIDCIKLSLIIILYIIVVIKSIELYDLPLIPEGFDNLIENAYNLSLYKRQEDKKIPRNLFIGFREIPPMSEMYKHTLHIINHAKISNWTINLMDQTLEEEFMNLYYSNTSLLWAYQSINDNVKAAAGDIWRYAALYAFGGFYIDDDAYIETSIEDIVRPNDTIILAKEGLKYLECYDNSYHLSSGYLIKKYHINSLKGDDKHIDIFDDKSLVQWAMFFEPLNDVLLTIMANLVDLIKLEYLSQSVLVKRMHQHQVVICTTGYFASSNIFKVTYDLTVFNV